MAKKTIQDVDAEFAAAASKVEGLPMGEEAEAIIGDNRARSKAQKEKLDAFFAPKAGTQLIDPALIPRLDDGRVPIKFRDGKAGTIDEKDVAQAINLGGEFIDPTQYRADQLQREIDRAKSDREKPRFAGEDLFYNPITNPIGFAFRVGSGREAARAETEGLIRGASMGISDAAIYGMDAFGTHVPGIVEAISGKKAAERAREYAKTLKTENPWAAGTGELAGTIAGLLATEGAGLLGVAARGTEAATGLAAIEGKIAQMGAEYGAKAALPKLGAAAGRVLGGAVKNAPVNVGMGVGHAISEATLNNNELAAEHLAAGAMHGLVAGAVADVLGGGALEGLGAAWKASKPALAKMVGAGNEGLAKANKEAIAKAVGLADAKALDAMGKDLIGGTDSLVAHMNKQVSDGYLKFSNSAEQMVAGAKQELAAAKEAFGPMVRELDATVAPMSAKSVLNAAEVAANASGSAEVRSVLDAMAERSGIAAERAKVAEEVFEKLKGQAREANPQTFEMLDAAKARLADIDSFAEARLATSATGAAGMGPELSAMRDQLVAKYPKLQAKTEDAFARKLTALGRENKKLVSQIERNLAPVYDGMRQEAQAIAAETADVGLSFSQARALKDAIKESGSWHSLPEPVKKMWDGIEGVLEKQVDKVAVQALGGKTYKEAKQAYQLAKVSNQLVEKMAATAKERGNPLQQALGGATAGAKMGGLGALWGGPLAAAKGAAVGAVGGGGKELVQSLIAERAPRAMAALTSSAIENEALAKLVVNTELALQAAVKGGGLAAKAAVLTADEPKDRKEQFKARVEMVDAYKENPDKFLKSIDSQLAGLSAGKRDALLMQVDKTMQYLATKIPPGYYRTNDPLMPLVKKAPRVTDSDMVKFNEAFKASMDPAYALKGLQEGRFRAEHNEALKAVFPQLAERGQTILLGNLSNATTPPKPAARDSISRVLDQAPSVSNSPEFLARIRGTYGPLVPGGAAENRSASQLARRPEMSFQKNKQQRMTPSQMIEMGEK